MGVCWCFFFFFFFNDTATTEIYTLSLHDALPIPRDPGTPAAWQRWEFRWRTPSPGSCTLRARATDVTGATQPASVPGNTFGYQFGGIGEHPVSTALPRDP